MVRINSTLAGVYLLHILLPWQLSNQHAGCVLTNSNSGEERVHYKHHSHTRKKPEEGWRVEGRREGGTPHSGTRVRLVSRAGGATGSELET